MANIGKLNRLNGSEVTQPLNDGMLLVILGLHDGSDLFDDLLEGDAGVVGLNLLEMLIDIGLICTTLIFLGVESLVTWATRDGVEVDFRERWRV